jgi:hypothetical protein
MATGTISLVLSNLKHKLEYVDSDGMKNNLLYSIEPFMDHLRDF